MWSATLGTIFCGDFHDMGVLIKKAVGGNQRCEIGSVLLLLEDNLIIMYNIHLEEVLHILSCLPCPVIAPGTYKIN